MDTATVLQDPTETTGNREPAPPTESPGFYSILRNVYWGNFTILVALPIFAFLQIPKVPLHLNTLIWSAIYYCLTAGSVTTGYHRLWAHRSFTASTSLRVILAALSAGAIQGSAKFWVREHRAHHRYTDTDRDPYGINKGFWHAHILWVLLKQPQKNNRVDISDLMNDRIVVWQHAYYAPAAVFMGWIFPALVAGLGWNDWTGGLLYAGVLRSFFVTQATFCVNSLAHYLGDQPFSDRHSPRNHILTALITMGEGYHNFHHEFPNDYRNGVEWHEVDVTKWAIYFLERLGMARDLKRFKQSEINKSRIQQAYRKLSAKSQRLGLDWGVKLSDLPVMEWADYQRMVQRGESLVVIEGAVHDVSVFGKEHPGGEMMLRSMVGKDATGVFNGGVYDHSDTARNILATLRVAVLRGGYEVEVHKYQNDSS